MHNRDVQHGADQNGEKDQSGEQAQSATNPDTSPSFHHPFSSPAPSTASLHQRPSPMDSSGRSTLDSPAAKHRKSGAMNRRKRKEGYRASHTVIDIKTLNLDDDREVSAYMNQADTREEHNARVDYVREARRVQSLGKLKKELARRKKAREAEALARKETTEIIKKMKGMEL